MFQVDSLVQYYKGEEGSLPCKLLLAAARQTTTEKDVSSGSETKLSKYSAKRRKRNIDMEEILIVNREL